jgi:phosphoglycerate dehydrogenase-like enzyme
MNEAPLRLLLSAATRDALAPAIEQALGPGALQLLALEDVAEADAPTVHAAFISRDITGQSSKTLVLPPLAACYRVLRRSPALSWVHTHSAGLDRPIYAELAARGVQVSASSGANAQVVAHTALAGVLALSRRFPQLMAAQREHRWAPLVPGPLPPDLAGQTAVVLGYGAIAQHLVPWLQALGLHVVVVRRQVAPDGGMNGVETLPFESLHQALPRADWLLLACPLTPQTSGCINATALAALPPGAHLVNVARGEVVDETALLAALQSGRLAGALLDVFHEEPLPAASPFWALPNVIVTPHAAGHAQGNAARVAAIFVERLRRWHDHTLAARRAGG